MAKVWLAAHWDKKLTKAHVFETNVESTVDSIISPQMKMALRTSGHLLLGVVRIYSRKQKYLLHDLGEACAKIKMAFRPGIVDLPTGVGAENADAITLPEIFHNFESAVSDLGALEIEAQYTINPSRASEITMAEDTTTTGGGNILFGGEFDGYDLQGDGFERGMEDIEVPRSPMRGAGLGDSGDAQISGFNGSDIANSTKGGVSLQSDAPGIQKGKLLPVDELPDAAHDFGGGEFLGGDGFGGEFGMLDDIPGVPDLGDTTSKQDDPQAEVPMEVDPPQATTDPQGEQQPLESNEREDVAEDVAGRDTTNRSNKEEEGFVLEPVEVAGVEEKRAKRKRRLVVDTDKEFTGQQIKSQFDDFKDLLQPKCFPPPTKKAMMWKEMAGCDQLYSNPTTPTIARRLQKLIVENYSAAAAAESYTADGHAAQAVELDNIADIANTTIDEIERARESRPEPEPELTPKAVSAAAESKNLEAIEQLAAEEPPLMLDGMDEFPGEMPGDFPGEIPGGDLPLGGGGGDVPDASTTVLSDLGLTMDFDGQLQSMEEQQESGELTEEFEERQWTKRTQQVLHVLQSSLKSSESVYLSSLTTKCNRKQAASRFYTCLLLAKEGMVLVEQPEPYADILLQKGPKFTE